MCVFGFAETDSTRSYSTARDYSLARHSLSFREQLACCLRAIVKLHVNGTVADYGYIYGVFSHRHACHIPLYSVSTRVHVWQVQYLL